MNISREAVIRGALPLAGVALLITSCGESSPDGSYSSAEDFRAALEEEGFPCTEMDKSTVLTGHGESLRCDEGQVLTVWEEDLPDYAEGDGAIPTTHDYHLRSETWNVASQNAEQLDAMQEVFGGERTSVDLADSL